MDTNTTAIVPIPLDQLAVSEHNARKIDRAPLDSLAASILAEGLLQNLTVIEGAPGSYEVIAGKRRLGALLLLRERGQLPTALSSPPCRVVDDERAISASLAENIEREAMHPADEFIAFRRLFDAGRTIEEIAQEFGTIPLVVQRRLRLASVAPTLFELFRRDEITLDQMMALAITDDHAAQEAAWANARSPWEREAHRLRERLTPSEFNIARDKAARFVGADALAKSGCIIRRDLFSDKGDGYTKDRQLVDELALAKLDAIADSVRNEGWSWAEARVDFNPYGSEFGRISPERTEKALSAKDQARLDELQNQLEAMDAAEDDSDEFGDRYEALESEIERLQASTYSEAWAPAQYAAAGAIVTIAHDGGLEVIRGLVRTSDRKAAKAASGGQLTGGQDPKKKPKPGDLSAPMLQRLGAQRSAMLQAAVLGNRNVALAILAHALLLGAFYPDAKWHGCPSQIKFGAPAALQAAASELPMMRYFAEMAEVLNGIQEGLPPVTKLLSWLLQQPQDVVLSLLAAATSQSIDAHVNSDVARESEIATIIHATGVDFAGLWEPTRETFLGHVPRSVVEEAVREARGDADAAKLDGLKKEQVVDVAEQLLAGQRWLPKPLRTTPAKGKGAIPAVKPEPASAPSEGKARPKRKASAKKKSAPKARTKTTPKKRPAPKSAASKPAKKSQAKAAAK